MPHRRRAKKEVREPDFGEKPEYLTRYLGEFAGKHGEEPLLVDKPTGDMKTWRRFNIVYPVGGGVFIHVTNVERGATGYAKYNVIEPPRPPAKLLKALEEVLAYKIKPEHAVESAEEQKRILLELLEEILELSDKPLDYSEVKPRNLKVRVFAGDVDYVKYHLIRDKIGLGLLEPFLRDPYLEDVSSRGVGYIYVVHKIFGSLESNVSFSSEEELDEFIIKLGEKIGKPISRARPIVDATLPDGSRINIVYGKDVSLHGSNFTIRRVAKIPISVTQLIKWGTFNELVAAYMWMMLSEGMSAFICGETASGKTTALNALAVFIRPNYKIVTIEDTAEVVLPHSHWVRELSRDTGKAESSVTMFDLLRAALRQRPNYIIVGEIRGPEGNIAFQAMQSVAWGTPIAILNEATGKIAVMPIGEFVDRFYSEGEEGAQKPVKGYKTLSLNEGGRVVWAEIKYVLRHKARELYEVGYEGGGVIRATGSHSVFVLDEETLEVKPKPVSDLKPGELLITFAKRPGNHADLGSANAPTYPRSTFRGVGGAETPLITQLAWLTGLNGFKSMSYMPNTRQWSERVPLRPIVKLLEESGLSAKLPPHLLRFLQEYSAGKLRYVTREVASELLDFIEKHGVNVKLRDVLAKLKIFLESDIVPIEVTYTRRVEYDGYVYDVSVPGTELFFGGEIPVALHNTGHPVLSTFHAANLERLLQRLTNPPISVPKTNLDNLNIAWFQSSVYDKRGLLVRRMISVYEILGYDPRTDSIAALPTFTWDPVSDTHRFAGRGASYLLEEKIAVMKGIPRKDINLIYEELELRAKFLKLLVEKGILDYFDVYRAVVKTYELGLEEAYRRLLRGNLP